MKILLLSTLYSLPGEKILNNTNVCGSFAKEWAKSGHEVHVIYQYPIYHKILHWAAKFFEKFIANRFYGAVTTKRITSIDRFNVDNVSILRIPLYKIAPHFFYSNKEISSHIDKIIKENEKDCFIPDVIVGHFFYPNIEIVSKLKKVYNCKSAISIHYQGININKVFKRLTKNGNEMLESIDSWGYRSVPIQRYFEAVFGQFPNYFFCFSGVPKIFFSEKFKNKDFSKISKITYVGALIKRKHPLAVVKGAYKTFNNKFTLSYIGSGNQRTLIEQYAKKEGIPENVVFYGHVERGQIARFLEDTQIFIMISSKETFGLVYLEAMSKGCIVIASKNEGMEGIIHHGENGFLCTAGDDQELATLLAKITSLPHEELTKISMNAYKTALNMTDEKVAQRYFEAIIGNL